MNEEMDKFFYLFPLWLIVGGPFLYQAFVKIDKINKFLFEHHKNYWIELGAYSGMFKKVESEARDPFSLMRYTCAIISGKMNKEIDNEEILSELKKIRICVLVWNLIGIPIVIMFFHTLFTMF